MYEELAGKKLLVIGADVNDMEIIRTAQSMGIRTIACDWNPASPAKRIADEAWNENYRDVEVLAERCRREGVDGVMAGYSETRVLLAARLCSLLGKPFQTTERLVEITRDKRSFKHLCREYGVPVPVEYCASGMWTVADASSVRFPVIVKPADYGGRFGITVCRDAAQLAEAIEKALACSESRTVVVEEYLSGLELSAIYNLSGGDIALACVNDKYQVVENGATTVLCHATVTPSKHLGEYLESVDPSVKAFLRGIGARDGVVFFQMIAGEQGIRVFEMGYRLNGANDQHVIDHCNGINHMKMLISHALTGSMGDDIHKNNPAFSTYAASILAYAHGGTVGRMSCSAVPGENGVISVTQKIFPGTAVQDNFSTQQEGFVVKFRAASLEEVARRMDWIQNGWHIDGADGKNLLFSRFDTRRLLS